MFCNSRRRARFRARSWTFRCSNGVCSRVVLENVDTDPMERIQRGLVPHELTRATERRGVFTEVCLVVPGWRLGCWDTCTILPRRRGFPHNTLVEPIGFWCPLSGLENQKYHLSLLVTTGRSVPRLSHAQFIAKYTLKAGPNDF